MDSFGIGVDGKYSLERIGYIDRFCNHILFNKTYLVEDDIGLGDLTDVELEYMKTVKGLDFKHVCGVIKFYGKNDEN